MRRQVQRRASRRQSALRTIHNIAPERLTGDFPVGPADGGMPSRRASVEDPVEAVPDTSGTGGGRRRTVAVVDGDEAVRQSLEMLLGSLHLGVAAFPNGEALLDALGTISPDCVITEVFLPGMSGIDLLRELRARGWPVPVIVVATHADVPLAVEAMQVGALDFVEKPIIERVIVKRVKEALRRNDEHAR